MESIILFVGVIAITLLLITLIIFFTAPRGKNIDGSILYGAENKNSYQKADQRYKILKDAKIDRTYLKNIEGNIDEQAEKRL